MSIKHHSSTSIERSRVLTTSSVDSLPKSSTSTSQKSLSSKDESVEHIETSPLAGVLQFEYPFNCATILIHKAIIFY